MRNVLKNRTSAFAMILPLAAAAAITPARAADPFRESRRDESGRGLQSHRDALYFHAAGKACERLEAPLEESLDCFLGRVCRREPVGRSFFSVSGAARVEPAAA